MNQTTSTGIDGVSLSLIKDVISFISVPFTHICNLSISTGVFPESMKLSKVVPVFKMVMLMF